MYKQGGEGVSGEEKGVVEKGRKNKRGSLGVIRKKHFNLRIGVKS